MCWKVAASEAEAKASFSRSDSVHRSMWNTKVWRTLPILKLCESLYIGPLCPGWCKHTTKMIKVDVMSSTAKYVLYYSTTIITKLKVEWCSWLRQSYSHITCISYPSFCIDCWCQNLMKLRTLFIKIFSTFGTYHILCSEQDKVLSYQMATHSKSKEETEN